MKTIGKWLVVLVLISVLSGSLFGVKNPEYYENRDQEAFQENMEWFTDARFGMFIHWGPSSLTQREISWSRKMLREGCGHPEWGTLPIELYDNLYRIFNPVNFDAEEWVKIAKNAGMKYLVFSTKHHDGFCNFDASNTDYKITSPESPFGRDIVKELADACHKYGLKLGLYYSQPDWRHPAYLTDDHEQYIEYYHQQVCELLSNYGEVDIIWFDGLGMNKQQCGTAELFPKMLELQPGLLINNRCGVPADFDTPEQKIGQFQDYRPWESCIMISKLQWSWAPNQETKSLKKCIQTLVNCAGGDGNLLFNVGPLPLGDIEPLQVERLRQTGDWLLKYGESIYGTRGGPWKPDDYGVTTCKDNKVYVHILNWDKDTVKLPAPEAEIRDSYLLTGGKVKVKENGDKLEINAKKRYRKDIDTIVVLELDRSAEEIEPISMLPPSIAKGKSASASVSIPSYGPELAFDGDKKTRWATPGGTKKASIEVDLGEAKTVSRVIVFESHGNRTEKFELLGFADGEWKKLAEGTKMEYKKDMKFEPVEVSKIKLDILKSWEGPTIEEILVFENSEE